MTKGLKSALIPSFEPVFAIKEKQSIDEELLLPDYLPDIGRVLFLKCCSCVTSVTFDEDSTEISGISSLCLTYESCDSEFKKAEYTVPFKKAFSLKEKPDDPFSDVKACCCNVSYKMASQRRLEVKGSFNIEGNVYDVKETEAVEKAENSRLILKNEKVSCLVPCARREETFSVAEELSLKNGLSPVKEIIYTETAVEPKDVNISNGDCILNFVMHIHALYVPEGEENRIEVLNYSVPASKKLKDMDLEDNFIIEASLYPVGVSLGKDDEIIKDSTGLLLESEILCRMLILAPSERNIAADGFSTGFEYENVRENLEITASAEKISQEVNESFEVPAPSEIREIVDTFAKVKSISIIDEDVKKCFCDLEYLVLYKNADGKYSSLTGTKKISVELDDAGKNDKVSIEAVIKEPAASLSNGKLKFDLKLCLFGHILTSEKRAFLKDVKIDESKPADKISGYSMIIYYADKDDDLWDIGRHYKVDPERIKEENSLKEDNFKERTPLMIPLS